MTSSDWMLNKFQVRIILIYFKHILRVGPFLGHDITQFVLTFLNNGVFNTTINFTHIVLIPKCKNPENISQFRLISLCNVLYKLISKVLANRVRSILPEIISNSQSAFISGRLIIDNVLVSFELHHHIKNKKWRQP